MSECRDWCGGEEAPTGAGYYRRKGRFYCRFRCVRLAARQCPERTQPHQDTRKHPIPREGTRNMEDASKRKSIASPGPALHWRRCEHIAHALGDVMTYEITASACGQLVLRSDSARDPTEATCPECLIIWQLFVDETPHVTEESTRKQLLVRAERRKGRK